MRMRMRMQEEVVDGESSFYGVGDIKILYGKALVLLLVRLGRCQESETSNIVLEARCSLLWCFLSL